MKKLLIVLLLIIITGCGAKAPSLRFGAMWVLSERQNYDLSLSVAGALHRAGHIDAIAKTHIIEIGEKSNALYHDVVNLMMAYRQDEISLYDFESRIREFHRRQLELNATLKAYLVMIEWEKQ